MRHRWFWRIVTAPVVAIAIPLGLLVMGLETLMDSRPFMWLVHKTEMAWRRTS